jgi:uncharacterized protein YjbI with pentapeptide repeats
MAREPDPFDVEALERSLNDSATRVSTIWISFLFFGLYLVVAASTVTHRQLLLEDPVKLPAINVDLPLVGFFFLTPILFVVFHTYVLVQVLLLGRTAATYNDALDRAVKMSSSNAAIRQRLANTLFAQIFAGSPRERGGWLGSLLRMIAWLTLAIAPVLVLLVFQFRFLPYHSHLITWTLRILILLDLVGVLALWRAARQSERDVTWRLVFQDWIGSLSAFALAVFSWVALTFPGEPHAEWSRYWPDGEQKSKGMRECESRSVVSSVVSRAFPSFDRLSLLHVDVVDPEKVTRVLNERILGGRKYTRSFARRDLNCAILAWADLRGVDLTYAGLRGAGLLYTNLEGADLSWADLQHAEFLGATLDDASLQFADLRRASLEGAELRRAHLDVARLEDASLHGAQLHGAELSRAQAQGADLSSAALEGARLKDVRLQGASLDHAYLQFAVLDGVQLQGANLSGANLSAARLIRVGLQGANLNESPMQDAILSAPYVWRARNAVCADARVDSQRSDALLPVFQNEIDLPLVRERVPGTSDNIAKFIEESVAGIADPNHRQAAIDRMRSGLVADPAKDDTAPIGEVWRKCGEILQQISEVDFEKRRDAFLRALFCDTKARVCARDMECDVKRSVNAIAKAIPALTARKDRLGPSVELARGMLGEDGPCAATMVLDEENKARLREVIASANHDR